MIRTTASAVLAALGALALGGCGTLTSICSPEEIAPGKACRVYGGTRLDVEEIGELYKDHPGASDGPVSKAAQAVVGTCILAADVPLSLAADTVTLPITLANTVTSDETPAKDAFGLPKTR